MLALERRSGIVRRIGIGLLLVRGYGRLWDFTFKVDMDMDGFGWASYTA